MSMSRGTRLGAVTGLVAVLSCGAGPALADRPQVVTEPWRETVRCGSVTGVATGTVVQTVHLRESADGTVRFVLTERVVDSVFTTSDGEEYRVLGAGSLAGEVEPEFVVERRLLTLEFIGPDGRRLGALQERVHDGISRASGSCAFVEDQDEDENEDQS